MENKTTAVCSHNDTQYINENEQVKINLRNTILGKRSLDPKYCTLNNSLCIKYFSSPKVGGAGKKHTTQDVITNKAE